MSHPRDLLLAHNCPNCGARMDSGTPGAHMMCRYCGQAYDVPAPPPPPPQFSPPHVVVVSPIARRGGASIVGTVMAVVGIGIAVSFAGIMSFVTRQAKSGVAAQIPNLASAVSMMTSSFLWDTVGGPPLPVAVGSGGVEGFVGRIRSRPGDELWVVAFDGAKLGQLWKAGPFGTYSEGYRSTYTTVAERSVIVTDYRATVHVYDVATGKETRSLKLSDRAKGMCASPDGKARVFIQLSDERNVLFDADQGTATPSPRPSWCPDAWATSDDCRGWLKRGAPLSVCRGPDAAPKVNGFQAANVVEDGDLAVALGKKHPGTAVPMAVGFDPKTKAVRWEQPVGSGDQASVAESSTISIMDSLSDGRFVAPFELSPKGWHVTAFDARSGQRLWDTALQPLIGVDHPEGFSLSPTRLYVMRTSSVEIYDAKSGSFIGALGM